MRLYGALQSVKNRNPADLVGKMTKDYSNLPETYIKRAMEQDRVIYRTPRHFIYRNVEVKKTKFHFTMNRPWTSEFKEANPHGRPPSDWVEPIKHWAFFRGDRVEVLVGKDKGKQGIINYIVQERNWVIVEGLNCEFKTFGQTKDFPGILVKTEMPLVVNYEVALVDPSDKKATTFEWRWTESGERVRVSARTGRIIPVPVLAEETYDYKTKSTYPEKPKDTKAADVTEITFVPKLKTFEMDIMDSMGIKETRTPYKTYWY